MIHDEDHEFWVDIDGYEGIYQVSNLGRIKSLERYVVANGIRRRIRERILKNNVDKHGYVYYFLYKRGKCERIKGHRIVAKVFVDNPNNYNFVNHKDENKQNNKAQNLEWCSQTYNLNYGTRSKKYMKSVLMLDKNKGDVIKQYDCMAEAEKETGISHSKISCVCHGNMRTAGGYSWRFAE